MDRKELKQKIRKLKKLELMIRYDYSLEEIERNSVKYIEKLPLVWNEMFDLNSLDHSKARYSLIVLEKMENDRLKQVFDEFWFSLYYHIYQEKGIQVTDIQEPELLKYLGLPYNADADLIKKRFRELCKSYHPDEGGDKEKFIELINIMEKYDLR